MQMLSGYLKQLFETADRLTADQRVDAGRAALDLLAMALRDVTPSVTARSDSTGGLLEMMLTHVRDHLADPQLRVEELARRHHVSVRRAYTLFEQIGTTPGAYLRQLRLQSARVMLSDPRHARRTVSDVAGAVGFLQPRIVRAGVPPGVRDDAGRLASRAPRRPETRRRRAERFVRSCRKRHAPLSIWRGRLARAFGF